MSTMQDLINQDAADAAKVATDGANITSLTTQLTAAQGQQTTDQATQVSDQGTFNTALATTGPVGSLSADGLSVVIYAAPGQTIPANVPIPMASTVQVPPPPPPPSS